MVSEALRRSFMEFQLSCTSHLPWIWVMETLARSNQVDVSLLLDLVEKTQELSDDLSRSTREFVSLRILENVVYKEASASHVSYTSCSKIDLNPSERCEDVVRKILLETSASNLLSSGPDMLKWNLESFVVQKRASLTNFALQQLKVSILKGSHPVVASLKKHSDLPVGNPSEPGVSSDDGNCGIAPTHKGCDALTRYGAANVLLNSPALPHENDLSHRSLPVEHLLLAKRNGSGTLKSAGGKSCDDEMTMENGCETCLSGAKKCKYDESTRIQQYSKGQSCPLEKIEYVGGMGENRLSTNNECTPSKGLVGHNKVLFGVPNDKADEEQEQYNIAEAEAEAENKGILEFKMTNQDMYTKEQTIKINVSSGKPEDNLDSFCDSGYGEGSTDITIRRNAFLSSQCTYSQDSFAATDRREVNLCVKCNKEGELLVCRSNSCTSAVHLHCLGSALNSDTLESFYCPSCAYSRAIKQYEEPKEKTSLALKDLITFYCFGSRNASKKQLVATNQMKLDEGVEENNEVIHRNFIEGRNNCQREENVEDKLAEPSLLNSGDNLPAQGEPIESTNETLLTAKLNHGAKKMVQDYQFPHDRGQNHMDALVVYQFPGENLSRQDLQRSDVCDRYIKIRSKEGGLCPKTESSRQQTYSLASKSIDAEEMFDKKNEGTCASKYFVSSRSSVHLSRRMRRPWTSAEEETLKEGVRRHFSPDDKNIPWKTLLEFGAGIFQKGRTAMDLKDKWRNIRKADPN